METMKERLRNMKNKMIQCSKHLSILEGENLGKAMKDFNPQFRKQNKSQRGQTKRNAHHE